MNLRRRAIMGIKKSRLPKEYQEVEYLESTGTQYIDTGISASEVTMVESVCANSRPINVMMFNPFYGRYTQNISSFQLLENYLSHTIAVRFGANTISIESDNDWHRCVCSNQYVQIDDNKAVLTTEKAADNDSLVLFARRRDNSGTALQQIGYWRCQYFRVYNNGTLVRNFIPCYRKSDHKPGLYDLAGSICPLTGTPFYINAKTSATTDFIVGADVN